MSKTCEYNKNGYKCRRKTMKGYRYCVVCADIIKKEIGGKFGKPKPE